MIPIIPPIIPCSQASIITLNQKHAIPQQLTFEAGTKEKAEFTFIRISNDYADAVIFVIPAEVN